MTSPLNVQRLAAFTLLESLAAMAVIAVLAVMLTAGFNKARMAGSQAATANPLLPTKGVFNGKGLYLFLDGSVEGPIAREGIWVR